MFKYKFKKKQRKTNKLIEHINLKIMNCDKTELFIYTAEELFLNFIDEKRNEETENRFSSYIDKYFNFNENDKINEEDSENSE